MGGSDEGGCERTVMLTTGPPGGSDEGGLEGVCAVGGLASIVPPADVMPL